MKPDPNGQPTILEALAGHAIRLDLRSVPAAALDRAKLCILDLLGCLLAGADSEPARRVADLVVRQGGRAEATVVGLAGRVPAQSAALANGVAAHALELDDAHRFATGLHPGATVIPAALAVAEAEEASGEDLLAAVLVGYDVAGRIGAALNPSHRYRGFHSTGTIGPFGAAAVASRLLRLDARRATAALSLVASQGSGIFEFLADSSAVKLLHAGWAAEKGVQAALLAQAGLAGPPSALEGREGFARAYAQEFSLEEVARGLGSSFEVERVYFKLHAACGHTFSAIDAALALRAELGGFGEADLGQELARVRSIRVSSYRAAAVLANRWPSTEAQARFSIPYCVAAALVLGNAGLEAFGTEARRSPDIRRISEVTEVVEDPAITAAFPARRTALVEMVLGDGRRLEKAVDHPRGTPENPVSESELVEKFHLLAAPRLDPARRRSLIERVRALEKLPSVAGLAAGG